MNLDWHADRSDLPDLATLDQLAVEEPIDLAAVRSYRLGRVREQMAAHALDACILLDPVNIRYATGARNMQVFHSRNPARYLFVAQSGPVVLHEFAGCAHLAEGLETIDEIRPAITASYAAAGTAIAAVETAWAKQVAGLVREHCGTRSALGVERVNAGAALALRDQGFHLSDAQAPLERARAVKSIEELKCVRTSVRATEVAVARLRAAIRPGLSENELWSVLHQAVIALGGDYVETRLLSSTDAWRSTNSSRSTRTSSAATATTATSRAPSTPVPATRHADNASCIRSPTSRCTTTCNSSVPARRSGTTRRGPGRSRSASWPTATTSPPTDAA
jgi:Xaa-Pro dipeptidase